VATTLPNTTIRQQVARTAARNTDLQLEWCPNKNCRYWEQRVEIQI